ncbi:hypothetical protein ACFQZC_38690 [Streptacidiphilus monticola]
MSTTTPPYVDPHPTHARPPMPYTRAEEEQATAAWKVIVRRVLARSAAPVRSRRAEAHARRAFILGYVLGTRFGDPGPAERGAHVPLRSAAVGVCTALAEPEVPRLGSS